MHEDEAEMSADSQNGGHNTKRLRDEAVGTDAPIAREVAGRAVYYSTFKCPLRT